MDKILHQEFTLSLVIKLPLLLKFYSHCPNVYIVHSCHLWLLVMTTILSGLADSETMLWMRAWWSKYNNIPSPLTKEREEAHPSSKVQCRAGGQWPQFFPLMSMLPASEPRHPASVGLDTPVHSLYTCTEHNTQANLISTIITQRKPQRSRMGQLWGQSQECIIYSVILVRGEVWRFFFQK